MTTASEMQAKVTKTVTNLDRIDSFVNGGPDVTVALDGGVNVPTIQALAGSTSGAVDAAEEAAQTAIEARDAALAVQTALEGGSGVNAESLGFVKGLGTEQQTANRAAWIALLGSGGSVYFSSGDWDFRWGAFTQKAAAPLIEINGAGKSAKLWVTGSGSPTYVDISWADVIMRGVHWYSQGELDISTHVIGADDLIDDVDVIVENCWFTRILGARATSASTPDNYSPYTIGIWKWNNNHHFCKNGAVRMSSHRFRTAPEYIGNYIDGGAAGGVTSGCGGISHGFAPNSGVGLNGSELGQGIKFINNTVRNIKPLDDPGSAGNYGLITNADFATFRGNVIEKVYPFYGSFSATASMTNGSSTITVSSNLSRVKVGQKCVVGVFVMGVGLPGNTVVQSVNYSTGVVTLSNNFTGTTNGNVAITFKGETFNETLFTGDGVTTTFTGTFDYYPTPDSIKVFAGATLVADDADHGWAPGSTDDETDSMGRQYIVGTDDAANRIGWVDYNTRKWSLTFLTPPASGLVYSATYFEGLPVDNVEPLYSKSNGVIIDGNHILNCQGRQGMIGCKGNGQNGYLTVGPYRGGPAANYGGSIVNNIIWNRVRKGIMGYSRGIWCQFDVVNIDNNVFMGMADRILRLNNVGLGRQIRFGIGNRIVDYYGQVVCTLSTSVDSLTLGFDVDGLLYDGVGDVILIDASSNDDRVTHLIVERATISERITAGKRLVICDFTSNSGSQVDVTLDNIQSSVPWRGFYKTGLGSGGVLRCTNYREDNLVSTPLVAGSILSDDFIFETQSGALAVANSWAWSDAINRADKVIPTFRDTGGANTIEGTLSSFNVGSLVLGSTVRVLMSSTSTSAVTMTVNGVGPYPVKYRGNALTNGSLQAGRFYDLIWNPDTSVWEVVFIPDIQTDGFSTSGGVDSFIVYSNQRKECWGRVTVTTSASLTWDLPVAHNGWLKWTLGVVGSGSALTNLNTTIVTDGSGHPTGLLFTNTGGPAAITVNIHTTGF